jgi:hypothetical protein
MAGTEVVLTEPIQMGDEKVTKITFRKPTAGDLKRFPAMPQAQTMGHIVELASTITGQPVSVLDRMCLKDLEQVAVVSFSV